MELTGLYIPSAAVSPEAPAMAEDVKAAFEGGSTTGRLSFTIPAKTAGGTTLTGDVTYTVVLNSDTLAKGTAQPGTQVTVDVKATTGMQRFTITLGNSHGTSAPARTNLWAGMDTPAQVNGLTLLSRVKGLVSLSWKAPAAGEHGGFVDASKLTYDILRLPDSLKVATVGGGQTAIVVPGTQSSANGIGVSAVYDDGESEIVRAVTTGLTGITTGPAAGSVYNIDGTCAGTSMKHVGRPGVYIVGKKKVVKK